MLMCCFTAVVLVQCNSHACMCAAGASVGSVLGNVQYNAQEYMIRDHGITHIYSEQETRQYTCTSCTIKNKVILVKIWIKQ